MTLELPEARDFVAAEDGEAFVAAVLSELERLDATVRSEQVQADLAEQRLAAIADEDGVSVASTTTMQRAADELLAKTRLECAANLVHARAQASALVARVQTPPAPPPQTPPAPLPPPVAPMVEPIVDRAGPAPGSGALLVHEAADGRRRIDVAGVLLPAMALVIVLVVAVAWIG